MTSDQSRALIERVTGVPLNPNVSFGREFMLTLGQLYRLADAARAEGRPSPEGEEAGALERIAEAIAPGPWAEYRAGNGVCTNEAGWAVLDSLDAAKRVLAALSTPSPERAEGAPAGEVKERTATDYAIEHGGYLARSVTAFLDLIGREEIFDDDVQQHLREEVSDHLQSMRSGVYEFEKRVARAAAALSQPSQVGKEEGYAAIHREQLARPSLNGRRHVAKRCRHGVPLADNESGCIKCGEEDRAATTLSYPPAPAAEPVAWRVRHKNSSGFWSFFGSEPLFDENWDREDYEVQPLYASPPRDLGVSKADDLWDALKRQCCATKPDSEHWDSVSTVVTVRRSDIDAILAKISSPDVFEKAGKTNTSDEHVKQLSSPGEEG